MTFTTTFYDRNKRKIVGKLLNYSQLDFHPIQCYRINFHFFLSPPFWPKLKWKSNFFLWHFPFILFFTISSAVFLPSTKYKINFHVGKCCCVFLFWKILSVSWSLFCWWWVYGCGSVVEMRIVKQLFPFFNISYTRNWNFLLMFLFFIFFFDIFCCSWFGWEIFSFHFFKFHLMQRKRKKSRDLNSVCGRIRRCI